VDTVIADPAGSAWTFGGSMLTFAFPMLSATHGEREPEGGE
jgi:hypothetical protein